MKDKNMEAKQNSHLKKVLKSYQLTAANTMNGPGPSSVTSRNDNGYHRNNSCEGLITSSNKIQTNMCSNFNTKHFISDGKQNVPLMIRSISHGGINGGTIPMGPFKGSNHGLITNIKKESLESSGCQRITNGPVSIRLSLPPPPILSEPDRSGSEKKETLLEEEYLSCFSVGGEERLCFPEVITVLRNASRGEFLLPQINQVCDELQIFCSLCSSEQLEVLKLTKVIPMSAPSCGLIRKTDAERLVNSLLHQNPPKAAMALNMMTSSAARASSTSAISQFHLGKANGQSASYFRVYHECFGTSEGIVMPHLYEKPDSLCIECLDCHGLLSPSRFVSHAHHRQENRTCHWGFDSANWRHYLLLSEGQEGPDRREALRDFKARFQNQKRKEVVSTPKEKIEDQVVIKRIRYSDTVSPPTFLSTSPTGLNEPLLPSKKRLILTQQSIDLEKGELDVDSVKKLVTDKMDKNGADIVNALIDSLTKRISRLETNCVCRTHENVLKESPEPKVFMRRHFQPSVDIHAKVSTMEVELGSLKKQLLRRHEQLEEI